MRGLLDRMPDLAPLMSAAPAETMAAGLVARGRRFAERLRDGLAEAGYDMGDPAELLLALRRIGPAALEAIFAEPADTRDIVASPFVDEIEDLARRALAASDPAAVTAVGRKRPRVVVATTDVHFYGKRLIDTVLGRIGAEVIDGGVSADPETLAEIAARSGAAALALSTYNGIALDFARSLRAALARRGVAPRLFIGGRLNQIMDDTGGSMPVDVTAELAQFGVTPCADVETFVRLLADLDPANRDPQEMPS
ncbi:cobalamin-dependent protein [Methylobrevis pamukkalensis]|uniref:Methylaspartate mutase subunit S n=1 Tax=Methylobrevis pamukkalensis TaxID=1439726 RepID=A0A1E3H4J1_9HYPH|nr:cobalamin-dependent protein [Methylobrevis pamukkalensis]ODN71230.1 methylaspartate mutase subunit S [Methylobrevis pamukkalensis]